MSESFEFREVTHFTAGAIGEPGARVFYLQAGDANSYVSVKLEKQQVSALATFLQTVISDLPDPEPQSTVPVPLIEPALPEWVVGQIAVGVDESDNEVVLVVEEISGDEDFDEEGNPIDELFGEPDTAKLRIHLSVAQAAAFIAASETLMSAGRPPCRLCGQPESPGGHACPRLN